MSKKPKIEKKICSFHDECEFPANYSCSWCKKSYCYTAITELDEKPDVKDEVICCSGHFICHDCGKHCNEHNIGGCDFCGEDVCEECAMECETDSSHCLSAGEFGCNQCMGDGLCPNCIEAYTCVCCGRIGNSDDYRVKETKCCGARVCCKCRH